MAIFDFVDKLLSRRNGVKEYKETLSSSLEDGALSDSEKKRLREIQTEFGLTDADVLKQQKLGMSDFFNQISDDERITDDEKKSLEAMLAYFGISTKDFAFSQQEFNKYYTLALIDKGLLPTIGKENHDLNLIFKNGEVLHYGQRATLRKLKNVTTRINYGGITTSIKIMHGLRYRAGSMKIGRETEEVYAPEDSGALYLTNQRIGFIGKRKQFAVPYEKISSFELGPGGLQIFKDGKETPYIVTIDDYEVPLSIVSFLLNTP